MTIECDGVFDDTGRILNLQPERLRAFKAAHHRGDVIRLIFDDTVEHAHPAAFKAFHAMRDELANKRGEDKHYTKTLMKLRYGVALPYIEGFTPPLGVKGQFVEFEGKIYWAKSTTVYSSEELAILIEGVMRELSQ